MKKIRNFLLLCLIAIVATGCIKFNATMDIKKDKSMDFTVIYAFDKSLMGENNSLKEEDFDEVKKQGFTVEKYSEDNFEGFKLTKKISNIDDVSTTEDVVYNLSGMMESSEDNKYMFKVVKDGDKSTYYAKLKFDSNDSNLSNDTNDTEDEIDNPDEETLTTASGEVTIGANEEVTATSDDNLTTDTTQESTTSLDDMDLSGMMSSLDLRFNVNLPNSAISSNATTKEDNDKKLSWKLGYSGSQTIEFAFEIGPNSGNNILLYVGVGLGVIILIAVIILLMRKGGKKEVAPINDTPIEINNDVNDNIVPSPEVQEEANVMNNKE